MLRFRIETDVDREENDFQPGWVAIEDENGGWCEAADVQELLDGRGSGTAEIADAMWTGIGGAVGAGMTYRITWGGGLKAPKHEIAPNVIQ